MDKEKGHKWKVYEFLNEHKCSDKIISNYLLYVELINLRDIFDAWETGVNLNQKHYDIAFSKLYKNNTNIPTINKRTYLISNIDIHLGSEPIREIKDKINKLIK